MGSCEPARLEEYRENLHRRESLLGRISTTNEPWENRRHNFQGESLPHGHNRCSCATRFPRRMKKPHFRVPLKTCRGCLEVGLLNGAGENRTPVPKQSTFHVYASSQVFNLDVVEVHLTNDNTSWQTKFLIPPGLASPLEPARVLHTALYQASRTVCRRLCCECVVSVAN